MTPQLGVSSITLYEQDLSSQEGVSKLVGSRTTILCNTRQTLKKGPSSSPEELLAFKNLVPSKENRYYKEAKGYPYPADLVFLLPGCNIINTPIPSTDLSPQLIGRKQGRKRMQGIPPLLFPLHAIHKPPALRLDSIIPFPPVSSSITTTTARTTTPASPATTTSCCRCGLRHRCASTSSKYLRGR